MADAGDRALLVHRLPEARTEIGRLFRPLGLDVDAVPGAAEALPLAQAQPYVALIAEHDPDGADGRALADRFATLCPDAIVLLLVERAEAEADLARRDLGPVLRFFVRPWERAQIGGFLREALKLRRLEREQVELTRRVGAEYQKLVRREKLLDTVVKERTKELEESYLRLKSAHRGALLGLAEAIEAKDAYTKGHCGRVAAYALALAREIGFGAGTASRSGEIPQDDLEAIEFASFLHDIGKIGVRDAVLLKPAALDDAEWVHMREHPLKGYEIASRIEALRPSLPAIRNHHEKWDGTGYPDKLKGEDIPLLARIVAIADAYDAMATDRPYKKGLPHAECERLLVKNSGVMFDPGLVELFVARHLGSILDDGLDAALVAHTAETQHEDVVLTLDDVTSGPKLFPADTGRFFRTS